jgi:hypothetical protein
VALSVEAAGVNSAEKAEPLDLISTSEFVQAGATTV